MPRTPQSIAERRAVYAAELARGTDRFHEPRRQDCPWCGSRRLRTRLRTSDLMQCKPGTFVVDECGDCAHAFQNPRLTAEGLAFYQRDFEDDAQERLVLRQLAVRGRRGRHRLAARALLPHAEPESWLDVGTGHGHFPAAAKEIHPYTAFDGLDPSRRVEKARTAGRVEEAHRGRLTDRRVAERLRARYDVVSMFHHLEHTADPRAELRAAMTVLRPGGHLLVEVPDPESAFGTLLGKWWVAHGQPRHLHLMPLPNLIDELETLDCEIVATDSREPHAPHDLSGALALALGHALPDPDVPWRPSPPSPLRHRLHRLLTRTAVPVLAVSSAVDHALAPVLRRTRFSNAYRVIARRPD
ncbi:class I SAM-dependent methyltransferase [Streptomyces sp. 142MFCol3.1]|uniref:class I SAM-dependent methyltransferase n=1 Tax=Streptomyces sp. 142MFCol3.1 TaxID=1172179 RepID=UPI000415358E|nr:class I SAM-dependent methyltransferase [Streptomyces sp. 142MFCol3.1]